MNYRVYLTDKLPPIKYAILETLILQYENHSKKLRETKAVYREDFLLYLRKHYNIYITDRALRKKIRSMYEDDHIPVGGSSKTKGYYVLDADEVQHLINEDKSRGSKLFAHGRAGGMILQDLCGQMTIEGI